MSAPKLYTAVDLIEKVVEFTNMTPDQRLWKEGLLKESPPRLVRLRQINALTKALFTKSPDSFLGKAKNFFTISRIPTIKTLLSDSFIKGRNVRAYEGFMAWLKTTVQEKEGKLGETGELDHKHLIAVYQRLLRYKKQLMHLLHFNDAQPVAGPVGLRYTVYVTDAVSAALEGKYAVLDKALALLIDPCKLSFSEEELQTDYNYPIEDLQEVDRNFP